MSKTSDTQEKKPKKSAKSAKKAKAKKTTASKAGKNLVIVESPAKATTIRRYLGPNYEVKASVGHIRDLPKSKLGVDVENDFKPEIINIKGKASVIKELKSAAKKAKTIYLAPDPDREGEAIAFHIQEILEGPAEVFRVSFNEITKKAVKSAIDNPQQIDLNKVHAQQARRTLDRLVGYKLSPLLWKKVRRGLSAGRVQSVAMRVVTDREDEIKAFEPKEYWSIKALLKPETQEAFEARLHFIDGKKFELNNETEANEAVENIKKEALRVDSVTWKDKKRNAPPPFITSTMQQAASQRFRLSAYKTMRIAQSLYEGVSMGGKITEGLITYMRTDSTRIADEAVAEVRGFIEQSYGNDYLPEKPNTFKSKKSAQEGHEAIRPTSVTRTPDEVKQFLSADEFKLYDLIWKRFVASQTNPAIISTLTVDVAAGRYTLRATGSHVKFQGFLKIYGDDEENGKVDDNIIPPLEEGDATGLSEITPNQHFTQPPPRYSEATLIRELEEQGIGRPSTYATIMSTIQNRDYANIADRKITPTELGYTITKLLQEHFPTIMEVAFTAQMEENLDEIEEGKKDYVKLLREYYEPFEKALKEAEKNMKNHQPEIKTDEKCEKCGADMTVKYGRFGKFLACTAYPECKNTKPYSEDGTAAEPQPTGETCPTCGKEMIFKSGRFGKFIACSDYPTCKTTKAVTLGIKCPKKCGGELVQRKTKKNRIFYGCASYPKCDFVSWEKPVAKECPACKSPYLIHDTGKKEDGPMLKCPNKECTHTEEFQEESEKEQPPNKG